MDYKKEDIEKYRQNIFDMVNKLKSAKILYCINGFIEDIAEEEPEALGQQ